MIRGLSKTITAKDHVAGISIWREERAAAIE
jgi:hypothetical protein